MDKSILVQKQARDNSQDLQNEYLDLRNWEADMKRKEKELESLKDDQALPPVRSKKIKKKETPKTDETKKPERIKSWDYSTWDKFADKACQELDKRESSEESGEEELSKEQLEEKHAEATKHKNLGNAHVKKQEWSKAIACYSEAIKLFPYDAIFYANRALCHLKVDNLHSADADCSSAIQLDEEYVKAYHRRATARVGLKQYKEAKQDLEKILTIEPTNKEAKTLLQQVDKKLESSKPVIVSGEDLAGPIEIEKKIGEQLWGSKEKPQGNLTAVETKIEETEKKPIASVSVEECTPKPFWPLEINEDYGIVHPTSKPPHKRSNVSLKRVTIDQADFSKLTLAKMCGEDEICKKNKEEIASVVTVVAKENVKSDDDANEGTLSLPKTAVQFLSTWKENESLTFRYRYLKNIPPEEIPKIFQDSMESGTFSQMITVLKEEFTAKKQAVVPYLKALSNVKRFRTLTMFMSKKDKDDVKALFDRSEKAEDVDSKELVDLRNKYEL